MVYVSATVTHAAWREEHGFNISVLDRVHIPDSFELMRVPVPSRLSLTYYAVFKAFRVCSLPALQLCAFVSNECKRVHLLLCVLPFFVASEGRLPCRLLHLISHRFLEADLIYITNRGLSIPLIPVVTSKLTSQSAHWYTSYFTRRFTVTLQ